MTNAPYPPTDENVITHRNFKRNWALYVQTYGQKLRVVEIEVVVVKIYAKVKEQ